MKVFIVKLCQHQAPDCPIIHLDEEVALDRQISITDDFGQVVAMSRDQFRVLIATAKLSKLDFI